MNNVQNDNIDEETIRIIGLTPTDKHVNAETAPSSRVFEYPNLQDVYIMESDLYGNKMPADSCFLAFSGQHGLIGKSVKVETLKHLSEMEVKEMVEKNNDG